MDQLQLLADPIAVQSCTLATQDLPDVGEVLAAEEHHLEDGERFGVPDDNRPIAKGSGRLLSSGIASAPLEELDGRLRPRIRLLRRKAGGQSTAIDFGSRAAGADDHFTCAPGARAWPFDPRRVDLPRRGRQSAPEYARRPWAVPLPVSCLIGSSRLASQSLRSSGRATQPAKAGTPTHVSASSRTLNSSFQRPSVLALTHQSSSMPNSVTFEWKWTGA